MIDNLRSALSNPDLAYVLLMLSILGISVEIFTPGLIFPSTLGILFGIFAFLALSTLPVNIFGLVLVILALILFIIEAVIKTRGLFIAIGILSLVFGSVFLFRGGAENMANPYLIALMTILMSATLIFVSNRVAVAQHKRVITGRENFKGSTALARTELSPDGTVFFEGERWQAHLDEGRAAPGEKVTITRFEGLKLYVTKKKGD
jgi:membrane-bound serine protease (ClpP class)